MIGTLLTAWRCYTRTKQQRWLLAGLFALFATRSLATRPSGPGPNVFEFWPAVLGGVAIAAVPLTVAFAAIEFRRISALRTVSLIPHSKFKLMGSLLLAQVLAAAVGTGMTLLIGHPHAEPSGWGTARGTFEMLFGGTLLFAVLLQVISGPSRILSIVAATLVISLGVRGDLLMGSRIVGMATADVLALAGLLAWLLFAAWYVGASRPTPPFSAWSRRRDSPGAAVTVSRQAALEFYLLGHSSIWLACRRQLGTWLGIHLLCIAMEVFLPRLFGHRHDPLNFSFAIIWLIYMPPIAVAAVAGAMAGGSRRLWLRSGEPRPALFAIAEALAWRSLALLGIPTFGLALAENQWLPRGSIDLVFPVALFAALTLAALYAGLLNVQGGFNRTFMVLFVVAAGAFLAGSFTESPQVETLRWLAPVALIAIAAVLRELATRRWNGLDWLRFRSARVAPAIR